VDKWLDEWISVTDLMALLGMSKTKGGQIQEDFLVTANKIHETWATAELRRLLELQERDGAKDSDLPTITTLVASFRQFLRIMNPQGSTFGTFSASLGLAETTRAGTDQKKPQSTPPHNCCYGRKHWYKDCYYINSAIRPTRWKPRSDIEAKIEEARKNPRIAEQFRMTVF
jgi:hypothetical protein